MSESAARATRRELRRAVGDQALGVIDTHTKLLTHDIPRSMAGLRGDVARHNRELLSLSTDLEAVRATLDALHAEYHRRRSLWERLRALAVGS